jgi:hypothetical protein
MVNVRARSLTGARLVLVAVIAWLVGCSDNTGTEPDRVCDGPVKVTATLNTTPIVSWSPQCRVNQVSIHKGEPLYTLAWATFFFRPVSNSMLPPIQYGVVPTGASQIPDNPEPLKAGTQYFINLFVADTMTSELVLVGKDTVVP